MYFRGPLLIVFAFLWSWYVPSASASDKAMILAVRAASNEAMRNGDSAKVLSSLTDNVLITTGAGVLLSGKPALREYIDGTESSLYFARTPIEVIVNASTGLAWETGHWEGFDPELGADAVVHGRYSAMWTKLSGEWLIKSQLFVTLE